MLMFLRLGGLGVIVFWAASMAWLVWHDVWPGLTAGDPPKIIRPDLGQTGPASCQAGIFNKYGHRIGTVWSTYYPIGEAARREDVIHVQSFVGLAPTLLEITSGFTEDGQLDELRLEILGHDGAISLHVAAEERGCGRTGGHS